MTTPVRRTTSPEEPSNRELMDRIERVERSLDKVLIEHTATHALIDSSIGALQRDAVLREERLSVVQRAMPEIAELHDFRVQVETLSKTAQLVFGGSLLAAIAAVASLVISLSHLFGSVGS